MDNEFALDEDSSAVIEDIKAGLQSAFHERGISVPENESEGFQDANIKIQKLAYRVIEHFDIPVIRTWYRYGQFEPYGTLRPKYFEPQPLENSQSSVPSNSFATLTRADIEGYFLEMDELVEEWEQPLIEFLQENYEQEAEDNFREVYLANLGVLSVLEELKDDPHLADNASEYAKDIKSPSIDLWYEMEQSEYFDEPETNLVRDFLDDLQMGLVAIAAEDRPEGPQVSTLREGYRIYHERVWPWPAMRISVHEADGPDEELLDDFLPQGRDYIDIFEKKFPKAVRDWRDQLRDVGLICNPTDYQSVKGGISSSVAHLDMAAVSGNQDD